MAASSSRYLTFFLALPMAALFADCSAAADPPAAKPNIIWIMADDLGYGDLGCYGQKEILTPCIDQLARDGMRFTQCYAGSTVCAPTRCVLMTGKHTGHCTVRGNSARVAGEQNHVLVPLRPEDITVAEVLKQAGYTGGVCGKWGLGERDTEGIPSLQGFDRWLGFLNQRHAHTYYPEFIWENQDVHILDGNRGGHQREWVHDRLTEFALDFIGENRSTPFFLYVAYTIPHGRYEIGSDRPYSDRPWPQSVKNYAAMVTRMDRDVGRIVDRLISLGLDRKTIVFFTSDNGAEIHYFRRSGEVPQYEEILKSSGELTGYKRDLTEGGIRVPMIARWPGHIAPGTESDHVWAFWDFLPTAADLAGVPAPDDTDGISVVPELLGKSQPKHEFLYWEFFERGFQQAVRYGDWKAIRLKQGQPLKLYNLADDIREQHDLAAERPEIIDRIEAYLRTARTESKYWP